MSKCVTLLLRRQQLNLMRIAAVLMRHRQFEQTAADSHTAWETHCHSHCYIPIPVYYILYIIYHIHSHIRTIRYSGSHSHGIPMDPMETRSLSFPCTPLYSQANQSSAIMRDFWTFAPVPV